MSWLEIIGTRLNRDQVRIVYHSPEGPKLKFRAGDDHGLVFQRILQNMKSNRRRMCLVVFAGVRAEMVNE